MYSIRARNLVQNGKRDSASNQQCLLFRNCRKLQTMFSFIKNFPSNYSHWENNARCQSGLLKSHSTEKREVIGPKAICI